MGLSLIFLLFLVLVFGHIKKINQKKEQYMQENESNTATHIKCDRRQMKAYTKALFITGIIFLLALIIMHVDSEWLWNKWFSTGLMLVSLYGLMLGGLVLILLIYLVLDGVTYFRRLEARGYEIPDDKRQYDSMLELLPRTNGEWIVESEETVKNKTSKVLLGLCVLVYLVMLGLTIWYYRKWSFIGDDALFLLVIQLVTDVLWICPIRLFNKQTDNRKYKDDVEIDAARKNRLHWVDGLVLILVLAGASLLVKNTAHNMSEYMYQTWMSQDEKRIGGIRDVFEVAYIDPAISKDDESWRETMAALEEGVDITTWGVPEGEYQEAVAMMLEITDFSSLKNSFQSTDGPAIVYVKMENGRFAVELMNLYEVADRRILAISVP